MYYFNYSIIIFRNKQKTEREFCSPGNKAHGFPGPGDNDIESREKEVH